MSTALLELSAGDDPAAWARLGFSVDARGTCPIGPVAVRLSGGGGGLLGWTLAGEDGASEIDGIATAWSAQEPLAPAEHANGAAGVDHVVVFTDSRARTVEALVAAGGDLRRTVESPPFPAPMSFVRLGPVIVEVAERPGAGGASLWGLVAVVPDVDALGDRVGRPRAAVQPGRRIATAHAAPGLEVALAFMTPR